MSKDLDEIVSAEAYNYGQSKAALEGAIALVDNVQTLYQSLGEAVLQENVLDNSERGKSLHVAIRLSMRCGCLFMQSILKLMRGYRGDASANARMAIDCCAVAVRILKFPHMADLWINAHTNDEAFHDYRNSVEKRK